MMVEARDQKSFLVIEDEERGQCRVAQLKQGEEGVVLARAESEEVGWLIAAALPVALLRDEPWVMTMSWSDFEFRIRDVLHSGVKLETVGVHAVREAVELVVALTRTPASLMALLQGAPQDVLQEALIQLREAGSTDTGRL